MLSRHALVLLVVVAAGYAYTASLFPAKTPQQWTQAEADVRRLDAGFQATVDRVNDVFRSDWQSRGVTPAPRADELLIARRISLALTGTIPSLEEVRMFEAARGDKLAWWTAGMLRDARSSDFLAERYARAFVGVDAGPFLIYRRRRFVSWLAEALHENRPYDELARQLIAGRGMWTDQPQTNFLTAAVPPDAFERGPDETVLAGRVYRAFLGVRVDCANCHDHYLDEQWKQHHFHNLAAHFGHVELSLIGIREGRHEYQWQRLDADTGDVTPTVGVPEFPFAADLLPAAAAAAAEGDTRQRLAEWLTHPRNRAFSRAAVNRAWAILFGRPLVEPVDNIPWADVADLRDIDWNSPRFQSLGVTADKHRAAAQAMEVLAEDFAASGFDLRRLFQLIVSTDAFQLDSSDTHLFAGPAASLDEAAADELVREAQRRFALFPMTRLRPQQVVRGVQQACTVQTIDHQSHVLFRLIRYVQENQFVERYGDLGADEFSPGGGTIPQRLILLNGELLGDRTRPNPLSNASTHVARLAPDDESAVECAYLAVLTRRPSEPELAHFLARLAGTSGDARNQALEDLFAVLLNSTEFAWNH